MIGPAWMIPMEAVRHGASREGAIALAGLDAQHARYVGHVRLELTPVGFLAHVTYTLPPHVGLTGAKAVQLAWDVQENRLGGSPFALASMPPTAAVVGEVRS